MTNYLDLWKGRRGGASYVKCIGVRGAFDPAGRNQMNVYDDDFILSIGDDVSHWKGSTDPGQYFINHPENPRGCAQLQPGIWMYKIGLHRQTWRAFIQAEDVTVNRLGEDGNVDYVDTGDFGIHIHSGGPGVTVDHFSAGCQIIACPEGYFGKTWHAFFDPAAAAMIDRKQSLLPYMLVEASALE